MQAVQRKTEYRPSAPKKRVVKIEGNVAYINTRPKTVKEQSQGASRNKGAGVNARRPGSSVISTPAKQPQKQAAKAKRLHKGVASTIIVIFIAFCALALLVSRYAAVCVIDSQNNKIKSDIESIEARIEELKVNMEMSSDLEYVRDTAMNKLGMKYPEQGQRVGLDMS